MKQHEHVCIALPPPHPNKRQQVHLIIIKYYNNVIHLLVGGVEAVVDAGELVLGQGL